MKLELHFTLRSDATFGRGDGVVGLVDQEVEYDPKTGLPFLRGRTLKGLLVEECANILYATTGQPGHDRLEKAARFLFGSGGSTIKEAGHLHVGPARLPKVLRKTVQTDIEAKRLNPAEVLASLTDIRRQTAVDDQTGAPDEGSLRAMRVIIRQTPFMARLSLDREPEDDDSLALLNACVMAFHRAGTGRNRGRGRLQATLVNPEDEQFTGKMWTHFQQIVKGGAA